MEKRLIILVLSGNISLDLKDYMNRTPIFVLDTPSNKILANSIWNDEDYFPDPEEGLILFDPSSGCDLQEDLRQGLVLIDDMYGGETDRPWQEILVVGIGAEQFDHKYMPNSFHYSINACDSGFIISK